MIDIHRDCECDHDFASDCPDALLKALNREIEKKCAKDADGKDQYDICKKGDSEATIEAKLQKLYDCLEARVNRDVNCFRGGDRAHVGRQGEVIALIDQCQRFRPDPSPAPPKK